MKRFFLGALCFLLMQVAFTQVNSSGQIYDPAAVVKTIKDGKKMSGFYVKVSIAMKKALFFADKKLTVPVGEYNLGEQYWVSWNQNYLSPPLVDMKAFYKKIDLKKTILCRTQNGTLIGVLSMGDITSTTDMKNDDGTTGSLHVRNDIKAQAKEVASNVTSTYGVDDDDIMITGTSRETLSSNTILSFSGGIPRNQSSGQNTQSGQGNQNPPSGANPPSGSGAPSGHGNNPPPSQGNPPSGGTNSGTSSSTTNINNTSNSSNTTNINNTTNTTNTTNINNTTNTTNTTNINNTTNTTNTTNINNTTNTTNTTNINNTTNTSNTTNTTNVSNGNGGSGSGTGSGTGTSSGSGTSSGTSSGSSSASSSGTGSSQTPAAISSPDTDLYFVGKKGTYYCSEIRYDGNVAVWVFNIPAADINSCKTCFGGEFKTVSINGQNQTNGVSIYKFNNNAGTTISLDTTDASGTREHNMIIVNKVPGN